MQPQINILPIATLASGDRLSLQIYQFIGAKPGKKVYIQSNLHGAEIAGNAVIHELIAFLSDLEAEVIAGEIWLVPACNPFGINQRSNHFSSGRFNPYDGKDWNRIFWDYEKVEDQNLEEFAQIHLNQEIEAIQSHFRQHILTEFSKLNDDIQSPSGVPFGDKYRYQLQSLCLDADYVIDLHSSTDQGLNYLYFFRHREDSAMHFLLPVAILLDKYDGDAFDESFIKPWLALEAQFADLGREVRFDIEAWTLELGSGMQMNPDSIAKGVRGIKNYLVHKGVLTLYDYPVEPPSYHDMRFTARSKTTRYYAPTGGFVQSRVPLGRVVEQGQVLYELLCLNKDGQLPQTVKVCAAEGGLVFDVSTNQAVNEGEYVMGIL